MAILAALLVMPFAQAHAATAPVPAPGANCADLLLITVRGSGESLWQSKVNTMAQQFTDQIGSQRTIETYQLNYTAAPMSTLASDVSDAFSTGGSNWNYFNSVNGGWLDLVNKLGDAAISCPNQKWAVFGYSQGALAVSQAVANYADPSKYAGIVLLANPGRTPLDPQHNLGSAASGAGITPFFGLAYSSHPAALSPVTFDICDNLDLVCDTSHLLPGYFNSLGHWIVYGQGFPPSLTAAINQGATVHSAYTAAETLPAVTRVADRALSMTVPSQPVMTKVVCSAGSYFNGLMPVKPLNAAGTAVEQWNIPQPYSPGPGASVDGAGFTLPGGYDFSVGSDGSFAGHLPPGRYDVPLQVSSITGTKAPMTLSIRVFNGPGCGGIEGFVTGEGPVSTGFKTGRLKGVTVSLYSVGTDTNGNQTRTPEGTTTTDSDGYYVFAGTLSGNYIVFFSDGSGTGTGDLFVDYFDYSTRPTDNYSDSPSTATTLPITSAGTMLRADQHLAHASSASFYLYDKYTGKPVQGITVEGSDGDVGWRAVSGSDGWATTTGRFSYDRTCLDVYDHEADRYIERGWYFEPVFGNSMAMYPANSITGTVTDKEGKPLPGADVSLYRNDPTSKDYGDGSACYGGLGQTESKYTTASAAGTFSFTQLYGGNGYNLSAGAAGYQDVRLPAFSLTGTGGTGANATETIVLSKNNQPTVTGPTPTISGQAHVGGTLSASTGTWVPASTSLSYQWLRNGSPITNATGSTYLLVPDDLGTSISVTVTGTKAGYDPHSESSAPQTITGAPEPGTQVSVTPFRALDTRTSTAVGPDSPVSFQVAGVNGIPANVSAVTFNLTVTGPQSFGFATAYPSGTLRPNASNVNFAAGQTIPNSVTVPVGTDGKVTLYNRSSGTTHFIADISGYYLAGTPTVAGALQPMSPFRALDTRTSTAVGPDSPVSFQVAGVNGIPANVSAVTFNLTVTGPQSFGFATAYPSGTLRPNASNVNFAAGQTIPNSVTVPVGTDGKVTLYKRGRRFR
ncbi:cutinase family protein [bacterium RCC_150]